MRKLLTLFLLLGSLAVYTQDIIEDDTDDGSGPTTRAIVVGVSKYQNIKGLEYADRDAKAFSNFLRSPAGGRLSEDNIKILLDSEATAAKFTSELTWLVQNSKQGDKAIIYFSGHGDVEKLLNQLGYLLFYDAPYQNYMGGGVFPLNYLDGIINNLSQKGTEVLMIADACRSGKLSGNGNNGTQMFSQNLMNNFGAITKLLSCQPQEKSLEDTYWGEGRGAFSYHLINGLYGMADLDNKLDVTVNEINLYLLTNVPTDVMRVKDGANQTPIVNGPAPTKVLSRVDVEDLEKFKSGQLKQLLAYSSPNDKSLTESLLLVTPPAVKKKYEAFYKALEEHNFFKTSEDDLNYADTLYNELIKEAHLIPVYDEMKRDYTVALLNDTQQFMNGLLKSDVKYCGQAYTVVQRQLEKNIKYLDRALELLGKDHFMYNAFSSTRYFFEGELYGASLTGPDEAKGKELIEIYQKALSFEADLPQVWLSMAQTYGFNLQQYDSAFHYAQLALDAVSNWNFANLKMAQLKAASEGDDAAQPWLDKMWETDSTSLLTLSFLGNWHRERGRDDLAEKYLTQSMERGTPAFCDYIWLGNLYQERDSVKLAEDMYQKALALDIDNEDAYNWLGALYLNNREFEKAEKLWMGLTNDDTYSYQAYLKLGQLSQIQDSLHHAIEHYEKAIAIDTLNPVGYSNLGYIYQNQDQTEKAIGLYQKAIDLDPSNESSYEWLGRYYIDNRELDKTEELFDKLYKLDSNSAVANAYLGDVYLYTQREDEGFQKFKKAQKFNSKSPLPSLFLGDYHATQEEWKEYMGNFLEVLHLDPYNVYAMYNVSNALILNRRYQQGAALLGQTYSRAPQNDGVLLLYAQLSILSSNYAQAEQILKDAISLDKERIASLKLFLAFTYFQTNRSEEGKKMLQEAYDASLKLSDWERETQFFLANGGFLRTTGQFKLTTDFYKTMLNVKSDDPLIYLELARTFARSGSREKAFRNLEDAFNYGYTNKHRIKKDVNFKNYRSSFQWKELFGE